MSIGMKAGGRGGERAHLVIEDLGLAGLGFRNQALVEHVKDILTDRLKLLLDLLTVLADGSNVLVGTFGFLLLLDGRDDAPGCTPSADNVLVRNREQVTLINGQFTSQLLSCVSVGNRKYEAEWASPPWRLPGELSVTASLRPGRVGTDLHVRHHL